MALLPSELIRLKAELGYNVLTVGAEPYIGITALFDQVIAPNLTAGAVTTSSTPVGAATSGAALVSIALASAVGFSAGARVVIDLDSRQETASLESISGSTVSLLASNVHSGTYPVTVEGGESIVRELLTRIREVKAQMAKTLGEGELKKVDEIEFYQSRAGTTLFGNLGGQLAWWRAELASVLGIQSMWAARQAGAQRLSVY